MDFEDFLTAAREYTSLGGSMQDQLDALTEGERLPSDRLNSTAVRGYIAPFVVDLVDQGVDVPDDLYDYLADML